MLPLGVLYCFLTILVLSIVFIAIHNSCRLTNLIHYERTLDLTMLRTNNPKVYTVLPHNTYGHINPLTNDLTPQRLD